MPQSFLMSSVVLMELMAAAPDASDRKVFEQLFRRYREYKSLIVPNDEDWLLASRILYLFTHDRKRSQKGKLQRLRPGASQRLALDVLIAVSARRWKAQIVTENWGDFKAIQRHCNTTIIKAANFFQH